MALRMVALIQLKNGQFLSRKVIPADVRDAYARLYGSRREAQLRQAADTSKPEAKARHAEWTAEIETRIETLRAQHRGAGQPLTKLNALALAGRWYSWFIGQRAQHTERDIILPRSPGTPKCSCECGKNQSAARRRD